METHFKNVSFSDGIGVVKMAKKNLKLTRNNPEWCLSSELLHTSTDAKMLTPYHLLRTFWTAGEYILIMGPFQKGLRRFQRQKSQEKCL